MNVKRLAALGLILGSGGVAVVTVGCGASTGTGGTGGTGTGSTTTTVSGSTTATTSGSTSSATSGSSTSSGMMCMNPGPPTGSAKGTAECGGMPCTDTSDCAEVCSVLFDCGLAKCGTNGAALCAYPSSSTLHDGFIGDGSMTGMACLYQCMQAPASFRTIADPTDCVTTVMKAK